MLPRPVNLPAMPRAALDRRDFLKLSAAAAASMAVLPNSATTPTVSTHPTADANERDLILYALDQVMAAGADYADVRISRHWSQGVGVREEKLIEASRSESYGIGVRALVGGSWGFSATRKMDRENVAAVAKEAAETAAANNKIVPGTVELAPVKSYPHAHWATPFEIDPESIPIEEKAELLFAASRAALRVPGVKFVSGRIGSAKERRLTATSDGSLIDQRYVRISPNLDITAIAADGRDFQSRGSCVEPSAMGWEYVLACDLPGNAARWAEEAVMKLGAKPVEPGVWDLVVHPSNLWLTIHENIGHPTELDRALGYEANYAGTSFVSPPETMIGKLRYGPEFMQIIGDRTQAGGCATTGWDDEGVPADEWHIIQDGVFVDYQTTREQAAWIAPLTGVHRSHGCAYGMDWKSMPFQRMPNVSLMPNPKDLSEDDVIAACDRGVYVEGRGSYSIDQQRYNFQFGGQVFWEIRNGKKVRPLRDVAYYGRTPEFWNSLALIGGEQTYFLGASSSDAKGQPVQLNAVSHGCPIALFRNVNILNTA